MAQVVRARLKTHIEVSSSDLPPMVYRQIIAALTVENPAKEVAVREKLWGAESMPSHIELLYRDADTLMIPRGFIHAFTNGMRAHGIEISWDDQRRWYDYFDLGVTKDVDLRDYQQPLCEALAAGECGLGSADTGAGKTEVVLAVIKRISQPTIIHVEKATLAKQWIERIKERLGVEPGYIGEGVIEVKPITVALRQAVWAAKDDLERKSFQIGYVGYRTFFDAWGCVVVDEVHHTPAETLTDIIQRYSARWRLGVSATVKRDPKTFPITQVVIGPVLYEVPPEATEAALETPQVEVLTSSFDYDYVPTHQVQKTDERTGEVVISPRTGKPIMQTIRNNYNDMIAALCVDPARNTMIAEKVAAEAVNGHHVLIVSRRKQQLQALREILMMHAFLEGFCVMMLLGGEPGQKKLEVEQRINDSETGTVLLSTVAEEGVDIPRLDRVVLAYPFRNVEVVRQPIGRIVRRYPGKQDAVVIDIRDKNIGLLASQYRERAHRLYRARGWDLTLLEGAVA